MTGSDGKLTVLIVDDEEMVRSIATQMLKKLSFDVLAAATGADAIDIFERDHANIDLVILDMVMPGFDGAMVFDEMKKCDPKAKFILSSGYSRDSQADAIMQRGCDAFIQKPFRLQELSQVIDSLVKP